MPRTTVASTGLDAALPAVPTATSKDWMNEIWTPPSLVLAPATRSLRRGSTRGDMATSLARALTERPLTSLLLSDRDLTKMVWSWGRKGFIMAPPLPSSCSSVCRMAALTCQGKRSPMMRMRGPDICTTIGLSAASDVAVTSSPRPCAACSLVSGDPCMRACRKKGSTGASPLVRLKPGTAPSPQERPRSCTSSSTVATCAPAETAGALSSSFLSALSREETTALRASWERKRTSSSGSPKR
mmetsp:Transcript_52020/g.129546  ORF Transcript_52020/g.129546 Transcript_52020/m.129546 type:complete len:242 (-) Transcript_52020:3081-3806(-)